MVTTERSVRVLMLVASMALALSLLTVGIVPAVMLG